LLVRRDCWDDLGGLDPDFFLYYEDVDLCRRAWQGGWSVWFDPSVRIVHHRPLHLRPVPAHLRLLTRHALLTYAHKHWSRWQTRLLGAVVRLETLVRGLAARWRGDDTGVATFAELGHVVANVTAGRVGKARSRLLKVVRHEEEQQRAFRSPGEGGGEGAPSTPCDLQDRAVHRHSQPPAARSAWVVSRQRCPARAAG
jgi:hypothetical protein